MVEPHAPRSLPHDFSLIAIATLIALSGYVIFAMRFGDPLRKAGQAVAESRQIESRVTNLVKREIAQQVQELAPAAVPDEAMIQRVAALEKQIGALQSSMQSIKTSGTFVPSRESVVPQVAASTTPSVGSAPVASVPPTAPPALLGEAVVTDRKGDLLFTLERTRIIDRGVEVHVSVTKEAGGDGAVTFWPPGRSASSKSRLVTTDGLEYDKGRVGLAADKSPGSKASAGLIEGVPMRFVVLFLGKFDGEFVCRRIELDVSLTDDFARRFGVRFENIAVPTDR